MVYNNTSNELWTALAEKAYVQLNELGWERVGLTGNGQNRLRVDQRRVHKRAQSQVMGQSTVNFAMTSGSTSFNTFVDGLESRQVDRFRVEVDSGVVDGGRRPCVCGRRLQRHESDRYAFQSVGHSVRTGDDDLESDPGELRLLRSDGVIGGRAQCSTRCRGYKLTSPQSVSNKSPAAAVAAMLAEINSLPSAEAKRAVRDRDRDAASQERRFHVGRHIVWPFASVAIGKVFRSDR